MKNTQFNEVRTFRLRSALSKHDLAFLVNQRAHSAIAQFERGDRTPTLEVAFALQVLFRQKPHQMFPGYYCWVEECVMRRAAELIRTLEGKTDKFSAAKREFLEGLASDHDNDGGL